MGVARCVMVSGRVARRAACMVFQRFGFRLEHRYATQSVESQDGSDEVSPQSSARLRPLLVDGITLRRVDLRHHRSARVEVRGRADNLPGLRLAHAELARHAVESAWLRQLRFGQTKLAILFAQLVERLL